LDEINTEATEQLTATILQYGTEREAGCQCVSSGKKCQLLRSGEQKKQHEMPVTVLPNGTEQIQFVMYFKPSKK
jgi:hypothetical protein